MNDILTVIKKLDESGMEEPKMEEPKMEEPIMGEPIMEEPIMEEPIIELRENNLKPLINILIEKIYLLLDLVARVKPN